VIHLDPLGPDGSGLQPLDLDPAGFQSPLPVQNYHLYHEDAAIGLSVGIWDTTTMQEAFGPYPTDEFIMVVEGSFAMLDGQGGAVTAGTGDSVCFHQGTPTSWKQDGYLRKIYLTLADPRAGMPETATAEGGVIVLRHPPSGDGSALFRNGPGTMQVHYVGPGAMSRPLGAAGQHEMVQVLSGAVEIVEPDCAPQVFRAGQAFFIPQGTRLAMTASEGCAAYRVCIGRHRDDGS
jgi:uncharacterized cupin superfamily protein